VSDNSAISWTDATWNPLLGCTKVSPGCDGCYAIQNARIRAGNPNPKIATAYAGLVERDAGGRLEWTGAVRLLPERLEKPLRWRKPRRIFPNSQADLFHDQVDVEFIATVFAVMALTSRHTYQLPTKRHARMRAVLSDPEFRERVGWHMDRISETWNLPKGCIDGWPMGGDAGVLWPLPNVHIGVSVENQQWADIRIPALLDTPAAVRWVSAEPLLGPVSLHPNWLHGKPCWGEAYPEPTSPAGILVRDPETGPRLDWVVCGGESGPGARPMHPDWARGLRDQCLDSGAAFHFKQWGEWAPPEPSAGHSIFDYVTDDDRVQIVDTVGRRRGRPWPGWKVQDGTRFAAPLRRYGKKAAGRLLDGREWNEYPAAVTG